ncbi:MAG: FecR domain-containing protein [Bacteroidales bacterium]|nr:FecR domain-containing protein [Bacteroidales bacterium]
MITDHIILRIPEIILKELAGNASPEEMDSLRHWLSQSADNELLYQEIRKRENLLFESSKLDHFDNQAGWENVVNKISERKKKSASVIILSVTKYAAVIVLPLLLAYWLISDRKNNEDSQISFSTLEEQITELQESSLILADGQVINLQTTSKESIIEIAGTHIARQDSTLLYSTNESTKEELTNQYNSLITPRSRVFSLILSDGTKVWLNASSAIRYPVRFTSATRQVYLTGEAYFEVSRDATKPFIVITDKMEVEVIGTSFNVMAYSEENELEATVVSGKVKIKTQKSDLILNPGRQAQLDKKTSTLQELSVDTEYYTSWRLGKLSCRFESLEDVLIKLGRWYNVEFVFDNSLKKELHFSGTLNKYNDIKETLHIIELATDVKFEYTENSVIVL